MHMQAAYLHPLAIGGRTLVYVPPSSIATNKADGGNVRVVQDAVDDVVGAVHNVQHTPAAGQGQYSTVLLLTGQDCHPQHDIEGCKRCLCTLVENISITSIKTCKLFAFYATRSSSRAL